FNGGDPRLRRVAMVRSLGLALLATVLVGMTSASRADVIRYIARLDGPSESPPNASPAVGFTEVDFDPTAHTLQVHITWSGLVGLTTASHIHAATAVPGTGTAIVATQTPRFIGFPTGVTSGTYDHTFDTTLLSTYNGAFVTAHGGTAAG